MVAAFCGPGLASASLTRASTPAAGGLVFRVLLRAAAPWLRASRPELARARYRDDPIVVDYSTAERRLYVVELGPWGVFERAPAGDG